jgi:hypothetical protein
LSAIDSSNGADPKEPSPAEMALPLRGADFVVRRRGWRVLAFVSGIVLLVGAVWVSTGTDVPASAGTVVGMEIYPVEEGLQDVSEVGFSLVQWSDQVVTVVASGRTTGDLSCRRYVASVDAYSSNGGTVVVVRTGAVSLGLRDRLWRSLREVRCTDEGSLVATSVRLDLPDLPVYDSRGQTVEVKARDIPYPLDAPDQKAEI